jgi:hypothetical protein
MYRLPARGTRSIQPISARWYCNEESEAETAIIQCEHSSSGEISKHEYRIFCGLHCNLGSLTVINLRVMRCNFADKIRFREPMSMGARRSQNGNMRIGRIYEARSIGDTVVEDLKVV